MKKKTHAQIIELMENKNVMSVRELAQALGCTEMTVRRNLNELQEMNFVRREHGYATLLNTAMPTEYAEQSGEHAQEKKAIAAAALSLIRPGFTICIDSGTTTQQLAEQIPEHFPLSVITPSLEAALALTKREDVQVMLPAGQLHHRNRTILITDPDATLQFRADIAFISCRSFRIPGGAFEHSATMVSTKRALAAIAGTRVLLLDHSKWDVNSLCNSIRLEELDIIITDTLAPSVTLKEALRKGKRVILADPLTQEFRDMTE